MRIGILTFHQSVNNGAVMQAYSLSKRLKKEYPACDVEVINYRMKRVERSYEYSFSDYFRTTSFKVFVKKMLDLLRDPQRLQRLNYRTKVFRDCEYKLPLSKKVMLSDDANELYEHIEENYDVLIVGSDAVWNYVMRGFPNAYFPPKTLNVKKLSYAASCYGMDFLKISDSERKEICEILSDFDFIGVRDEATENFVKWSGCEVVPNHTCDPTVFLDINDLPIDVELLKKKLSDRGFDFEKPTIGIMGSEKMHGMIRKMYSDKYQIVSLYNYIRGADVNLYDLEPYEWAYVFRYFKVTFTTYFHGTLVSLCNGVPVICVDLGTEFGKSHVPKTLDVLTRLGFKDWYFKTDYKKLNIDKIKEKADEFIDGDFYDLIVGAMDREAQSFGTFNLALEKVLGRE